MKQFPIKIITLFLFSLLLISSCNQEQEDAVSSTSSASAEEEKKENKKSLNPNGDSELALLMREMFDEAQKIKKQVQNGEPVETTLDQEKILTAHATEPEKAASPEFKAWAGAYLASLDSLKEAKPENAEKIYRELVNNCLTCHKSLCPGPIVRINKLKMPKQAVNKLQ